MLQRFPVIVGPTAGGKSALAVAIAHRLLARGVPAEILTADSMQVFRGMDIGTAKPTMEEHGGVRHHLIDCVDPREGFSVDRWLALAEGALADVRARGVRPIVVGGTHLYVKALLEGLFEGPGADAALREQLGALTAAELRAELERVDPASAGRLHPSDRRRAIRAIEVFRLTGRPLSVHQVQWDQGTSREDAALIGLVWPTEGLNRRINERVKEMFERGLVDEARALWAGGMLGVQAREALGYKQLIDFFEGRCTLEDSFERIKIETRRFAKNQRTWLRRLRTIPGGLWIEMDPADEDGSVARAAELATALMLDFESR